MRNIFAQRIEQEKKAEEKSVRHFKPLQHYGDYIRTDKNHDLETVILVLRQAVLTLKAIEEKGMAEDVEYLELVFDDGEIGWLAGIRDKEEGGNDGNEEET